MQNKFSHNDDSVVLVIGSGAGGGTLAHELCEKGAKVVVLEAGKLFSINDFRNDELFAHQQLTWADKRIATGNWGAAKYTPESATWIAKAVGGSTVHWTGLSFRIQPREFQAHSEYGDIEGVNLSDWPISYKDLAPYYDQAENKLGVTGTNGIPAHQATNNYKVFYNGARRIGYKNISNSSLAINTATRDGRASCNYLGFCAQGCKMGAKWSTLYSEIPKAEKTGNLDLRPECMALQIKHDKRGKVVGVLYADKTGAQHLQKARLVCVAGNVIETTRLLLNSGSTMFPDGLANSSGQVGKNYMKHNVAMLWATFDKPVHMYRGPSVCGTVFDEMLNNPARGFVGGYLMESLSLGLPLLSLVAQPHGWGREYSGFLEQYENMAGVLLNGEDLPQENNRITLHKDERDQYGLPVPIIHVNEHENEIKMRRHFYRQATQLYEAVGAKHVLESPGLGATHNMGTCRMSEKPDLGVVNKWGQVHDIDNLFVSDGSQFVTSTCENPTLTIVALAIRQSDYIIQQMSHGKI